MKAKTFNTALIILLLTFCTIVNATEQIFFDDFETSKGWVRDPFCTDDATTGMWERDNPEQTIYDVTMQLGTTVSGEKGLVTGHLAGDYPGSYDIDYGKTTVRSPDITLPSDGQNITLSFSYYLAHYSNATSDDYLRVKVVGTTTQTVLEELGSADIDEGVWETFSTSLNDFSGQTIYILIEAADETYASLVEAGIDDVLIEKGTCRDYPECYLDGFWNQIPGSNNIFNTNSGVVSIGHAEHHLQLSVFGKSKFDGKVGIGVDPSDNVSLEVLNKLKIVDPSTDRFTEIHTEGLIIKDPINNVYIQLNAIDNSIELAGSGSATSITSQGISTKYVKAENIEAVGGGELQFSGNTKIDGELWARKVTVTLDEFPDHVFDKDYTLKSLEEIEEYVKENKHLPGIPSEEQVKKEGLSIGEMQAKLLEKIEEMTLYMIELKKENKALKQEIEELKKK